MCFRLSNKVAFHFHSNTNNVFFILTKKKKIFTHCRKNNRFTTIDEIFQIVEMLRLNFTCFNKIRHNVNDNRNIYFHNVCVIDQKNYDEIDISSLINSVK